MKSASEEIQELDRLLEQRLLSGLWRIPAGERPLDPKTDVKAHLWKWTDIYDSLLKARDRIGIDAAVNERRTIRLVNPRRADSANPFLLDANAPSRRENQGASPYEHVPLSRIPRQRHHCHRRPAVSLGKGRQLRDPAVELARTRNRSQADEALLFSMHDKPVLDAFGLYREEGDGQSHLGL